MHISASCYGQPIHMHVQGKKEDNVPEMIHMHVQGKREDNVHTCMHVHAACPANRFVCMCTGKEK